MPSMPLRQGRECNCKAGVSRVRGGSVCVRARDRLPWLALCARPNQAQSNAGVCQFALTTDRLTLWTCLSW